MTAQPTPAQPAGPSQAPPPPAPDAIAPRLRGVMVGLRTDLEVHRHVFRGLPSYVIRDPLTLAVHRVSAEDYQIVAALTPEVTLNTTFERMVERKLIEQDHEEDFYRFILSLHSLGFLNLPVPDNQSLYERRAKKLQAKRKAKLTGFLFMQIPLWNPDTFLQRTQHLVAWAFSRWATAVWLMVVLAAGVILAKNWQDFFTPIGTIFTLERLVGLWFTLVGMKVLHEFGHAYVCRLRGGEVPEMGVFLLAGTPAAYVDATSSWGFTDRRDRLAVVLAGVYVELFIAALAIFTWATTSSAAVQIIMFDIVLVAGVATVLANLNPLMRFDGYYLASDLLEIPNLRGTSQKYTISLLKRLAVGTPVAYVPYGRWTRVFFVFFGTASALYKITIVLGISALLATKALWLGISLAAFYVGTELFKALRGAASFLLHSEEAASRRIRAGAIAFAAYAVVPAILVLLPVPRQLKASGTVGREIEVMQYPAAPGFLESLEASDGSLVHPGDPVAEIRNDELAQQLLDVASRLELATIRAVAAISGEPSERLLADRSVESLEFEAGRLRERTRALKLVASEGGTVHRLVSSSDRGRYITPAEPIAVVSSGGTVVRALVRADAFAALEPTVGDTVRFRPSSDPTLDFGATITRVTPTGSRAIGHLALTGEGGGDIPVSPLTGEANEPYFEVEALLDANADSLPYGATGRIVLGTHAEPVAQSLWRGALRLMQRLQQG